MELIVTLLFIIGIFVVLFLIEYWWILLIFIGVILLAAIIYAIARTCELNRLETEVILARIISREPIIERVSEKTGYSNGYGRYLSSREYYRYKNVITGYKVKFDVSLRNGKRKIIECNEDSSDYNKLIVKVK